MYVWYNIATIAYYNVSGSSLYYTDVSINWKDLYKDEITDPNFIPCETGETGADCDLLLGEIWDTIKEVSS